MNKAVADDAPAADVLWAAAERIGKSNSGDQIQKICDYLVNKHWFQTAGDLRVAQLATEEWHLLQIPSRLKIAVQQVLDEVQYPQSADSYPEYANYYPSQGAFAEDQPSACQHAEWPSSGQPAVAAQTAVSYDPYYYYYDSQVPPPTADQSNEYHQQQQGYYYDTTSAPPDGSHGCSVEGNASASDVEAYQYAEPSAADVPAYAGDPYSSEYYHQVSGSQEYYAPAHTLSSELQASDRSDIVEAHAVVVEEATTYEEILDSTPQEWPCNTCTFLNPISQSYCEMCHGHILTSPDMAGDPFAGSEVASASSCDATKGSTYLPDQRKKTPSDPNAAMTSSPTPSQPAWANYPSPISISPLYSPSAPSFEAMDMEYEKCAGHQDSTDRTVVVVTPTVSQVPARRRAMVQEDEDGAIYPTGIQHRLPPPAPANYLALAFKSNRVEENAADKMDQVRQEQVPSTECFL